ncbi:unnamed protein product [Phytophthora lilii]|uniref:Unnamed protein product n=1 Tax=Phytophthora lilii TaxID=2077276 RepID=A0A9W6X7R7_9STRA|nr:unnamed protein product [Phytophthora lilii]
MTSSPTGPQAKTVTKERHIGNEGLRFLKLTYSFTSATPVLPFGSPANDASFSRQKVTSIDASKGPFIFSGSKKAVSLMLHALPGAMALICFSWTIWLMLLTVKPNDTVNWVMKTDNFDNGSFWLLVNPPVVMVWVSLCGLSLVAIAYAIVLIKMVKQRNRISTNVNQA